MRTKLFIVFVLPLKRMLLDSAEAAWHVRRLVVQVTQQIPR